jgi:hypothetical protein
MLMPTGRACAQPASFDDNPLPPNSFWNGADGSGGFNTGGFHFNNNYNALYQSWDGWAYSSMTDTTNPDYTNQYSAITGAGQGTSSQYGVAYCSAWALVGPTVTLSSSPKILSGAWFTNTTYTYLSMKNGDSFGGKKFGGATGEDPDWFLLTITGLDAAGAPDKSVNFYLADFTNQNGTPDYIINQWTWVDLSPLGLVSGLTFSLSSSDVGLWGMNTPAYFAMDNLVPEPASLGLLALSALIMVRRKKSL